MHTRNALLLSAALTHITLGSTLAGCDRLDPDKAPDSGEMAHTEEAGTGESVRTGDGGKGGRGGTGGATSESGKGGVGGTGGTAPGQPIVLTVRPGNTETFENGTVKNPDDNGPVQVEISPRVPDKIDVSDPPAETTPAGAVTVKFKEKPKQPVLVTLVLSGASDGSGKVIVLEVNEDGTYKVVSDSVTDDKATQITFPVSNSGTYVALRETAPSAPVRCAQDFESGKVDGFEIAPEAKLTGMFGARPPALKAGASAEYTVACDNPRQTQLAFSYYGGPTELYIDDKKYEDIPRSGWTTAKFALPAGKHKYTWKVTSATAGRPDFLLDDIIVSEHAVNENPQGPWGFDEGFAPSEFKGFGPDPAENWQISSEAQHAGGFGARPPLLMAGASRPLELTCGKQTKANTGLEFTYYGGPIELLVDGEKYEDLPRSGWTTSQLVVPAGTHSYAWKVTNAMAGRSDFMLDTVGCPEVAVEPNTTGTWSLDEGFSAPELKGLDGEPARSWQITSEAKHAGTLGARPPILAAGDSSALELTCGSAKNDNTGLDFTYYGGPIELFIDGAKYEDVPRLGWTINSLVVAPGKHTYTWKVSAKAAGREDFLLDTIKCNNVPAEPITNGTWNLDEGYVPVEFEGFGPNSAASWQISSEARNSGTYGARPPLLQSGASAELRLNCGTDSSKTSQLSFLYYGGPVELLVDGAKYEDLPRSGWTPNSLVVPAGKHVFAWKVTAASAGRSDFMLDTFKCSFVEAVANATSTWTFDEGFVPPEFEGIGPAAATSWQITSEARNQGEFGVRPPVLALGASTELVLNAPAGNPRLQFSYSGGPAEFYIDGQRQTDLPRSGWTEYTAATDGAAHRFSWKLTAASPGRPDFLLDNVQRVAN